MRSRSEITFTLSGYQQTTIDGVVYATAFDFADLPRLTKGSRVEYERTGQRAQFYELEMARIVRVVT
jgi:hypothetical protein